MSQLISHVESYEILALAVAAFLAFDFLARKRDKVWLHDRLYHLWDKVDSTPVPNIGAAVAGSVLAFERKVFGPKILSLRFFAVTAAISWVFTTTLSAYAFAMITPDKNFFQMAVDPTEYPFYDVYVINYIFDFLTISITKIVLTAIGAKPERATLLIPVDLIAAASLTFFCFVSLFWIDIKSNRFPLAQFKSEEATKFQYVETSEIDNYWIDYFRTRMPTSDFRGLALKDDSHLQFRRIEFEPGLGCIFQRNGACQSASGILFGGNVLLRMWIEKAEVQTPSEYDYALEAYDPNVNSWKEVMADLHFHHMRNVRILLRKDLVAYSNAQFSIFLDKRGLSLADVKAIYLTHQTLGCTNFASCISEMYYEFAIQTVSAASHLWLAKGTTKHDQYRANRDATLESLRHSPYFLFGSDRLPSIAPHFIPGLMVIETWNNANDVFFYYPRENAGSLSLFFFFVASSIAIPSAIVILLIGVFILAKGFISVLRISFLYFLDKVVETDPFDSAASFKPATTTAAFVGFLFVLWKLVEAFFSQV